MTLRTRLTAAFLAVVLGPILLSAVSVGTAVSSVTQAREVERLDTASSSVRTSVAALCERARAAAEALASAADGATITAQRTAPAAIVARGLADAARLENGKGKTIGQAGTLPDVPANVPWGDCGSRIPAAAPLIAAVVEMRGTDGTLVARARAAFAVTPRMVNRLSAAAGAAVTVLDGDRVAISTLPGSAREAIAVVAATGGRQTPDDLRVKLLEPAEGQPLSIALSSSRESLRGLYALLGLVVLGVAALAVLAAWYLARTLTRPLADVAKAAELVASGDLDVRVPVRGRDEVGRLATTFNRMTRDLKAYVSALTASRDQLRGNLALLGDTLSSTHDLDRILEVILETVLAATGAQAGVVLLAQRSARQWPGVLVGQCGFGMAARGVEVENLEVPIGVGLLGSVAASGEPRLGRIDPDSDELVEGEPRARTFIAVPFSGSGRGSERPAQLLGVLALYDRLGADEFDDGDLVTLRTFAGQAAVAVENVLLHREAERLTLTDALTGLWNDRYLQVSLQREVGRAVRFDRPLSIIKVDLDRFGELADRRGVEAAEAVLADYAARIATSVREVDMVFRRFGERLVLLLPETTAEGACQVAARICERVRAAPVRLGDDVHGVSVRCTISVGVAVHPEHGSDADTLLERAEEAVQTAKAAGGDAWRLAGDSQRSQPRPVRINSGDRADYPDAPADTGSERG